MKIKTKLVLCFTGILLILILTIFSFVNFKMSEIITEEYQTNIEKNSNLSLSLFDKIYTGHWNIKDGNLYKGTVKISGSTEFVDTIQKHSGYLASIFMNDTRVSTNVFLSDGKRATGTIASAQVINAVLKDGKNFNDITMVAGKNVFTYYTPIKDSSGKIIGMWVSGIEKNVVDKHIFDFIVTIAIIAALSLLIGVVLSYSLGRVISNIIRKINSQLNKFSEGDFSHTMDDKNLQSKSELGEMSRAATKMQHSVRGIIKSVMDESGKINDAMLLTVSKISDLNGNIEDVSATTEQLSAGMQQTAATMQEMNATSHELEAAVGNIAKKAQDTSYAAKEINSRALALKTKAKESKDYAYNIYQAANAELTQAIDQSKSIEQIRMLSEAIMQITGETNLLALNAAIEASRAGEAGRGFAVVADQIRKLAENSKKAVGEIQYVTDNVLSAVGNLVTSSQNILSFIENTVIEDYNSQAENSEQYSMDAANIDGLVLDFSSTSEELLVSISSMMKAINEITASTSEAADGTTNIAMKASQVLEKGHEVVQISQSTKAASDNLILYVSKYKI